MSLIIFKIFYNVNKLKTNQELSNNFFKNTFKMNFQIKYLYKN